MTQTSIFNKKTKLIAGFFGLAIIQFASSCKTTDDPIAQKDSTTTEVYRDVEYASMTSSLSEARTGMQASTIGNKTYFIGGHNYGFYIPPNFFPNIDVFDGSSLSWSTEAFPNTYSRGSFIVAGTKIYFTGPTSFSDNSPSTTLNSYDLVTKANESYNLTSARFVTSIAVADNKVILAGGNDLDIIDLTTKTKVNTQLPSEAKAISVSVYKGIAYFLAENEEKIYVLNISEKSWSTIGISSDYNFINATDNKLILTKNGLVYSFFVYDLEAKTQSKINFSTSRIQPQVVVAGNKVFLAGGIDVNNGIGLNSDIVDIYDTRTKTISTKRFSVKRGGSAGAVNGKFVLFAGGDILPATGGPIPVLKSVDFFILNK